MVKEQNWESKTLHISLWWERSYNVFTRVIHDERKGLTYVVDSLEFWRKLRRRPRGAARAPIKIYRAACYDPSSRTCHYVCAGTYTWRWIVPRHVSANGFAFGHKSLGGKIGCFEYGYQNSVGMRKNLSWTGLLAILGLATHIAVNTGTM